MKVKAGLTPLGAVAVDEKGHIVGKVLFPKGSEAERFISGGIEELRGLKAVLEGHQVERGNIDGLAVARQLGIKDEDFFSLSKNVAVAFTREKMKEAVGRDYLIVQTVGCLEDVNHSINTLTTRLREWYGLYAPEMGAKLEDHEKYLRAVLSGEEKCEGSMGMSLGPEDLGEVKEYAATLERLFSYRLRLEKYIEGLMKEVAPNTAAMAGPLLGARLIAKAGTLDRLASFPSSTIQVLGAEKALFKHIVKGTPPPKHGMIIQHPMVSSAGLKEKGRVARALAAKIAIAARMDRFSVNSGSKGIELSILKASLDRRLAGMRSNKTTGGGEKKHGEKQA